MTDFAGRSTANFVAYASCPGGITNQKLALLGLFLRALDLRCRKIILPDMLIFDQVTRHHIPVAIGSIFDLSSLHAFALRAGVEILDRAPYGDWWEWDYVAYAHRQIAIFKLEGQLTPDSIVCDFFRSLRPLVCDSDELRHLKESVFSTRQVAIVAQLRIEKDWTGYISNILSNIIGNSEQNLLPVDAIIGKIKTSISAPTSDIYVVSDEAGLPIPKEEIRDLVKNNFGIDLHWKSDFLSDSSLRNLSLLDLSLMDFEVAIESKIFVGLSRSTFSSAVSLEKYSRTRSDVKQHYIYNADGITLAERDDNGAFEQASLAADKYYRNIFFGFSRGHIYLDAGKDELALEQFSALTETSIISDQERYLSLYRCAQIKTKLGVPYNQVIGLYLKAASILPSRAEALHGAARLYRLNGDYAQGYEIAKRAIAISTPSSGIFIERWIYEYGALDEFAVNAYWAGHDKECIEACAAILANKTTPADERARVRHNARLLVGQAGIMIRVGAIRPCRGGCVGPKSRGSGCQVLAEKFKCGERRRNFLYHQRGYYNRARPANIIACQIFDRY